MTSRRKQRSVAVRLTERALADLREIEEFSIAEWGRQVAEKYLGDFQSALDRIREDPEILQTEPDIVAGLYFYRVRKHYLVCHWEGLTVIVLTVIHTAMDLPARLLELEPQLAAEVDLLRGKLRRGRSRRG